MANRKSAEEQPITKRQFEEVLRKVTRKIEPEPKSEQSRNEPEERGSKEQ